jgi:hypothetical protein
MERIKIKKEEIMNKIELSACKNSVPNNSIIYDFLKNKFLYYMIDEEREEIHKNYGGRHYHTSVSAKTVDGYIEKRKADTIMLCGRFNKNGDVYIDERNDFATPFFLFCEVAKENDYTEVYDDDELPDLMCMTVSCTGTVTMSECGEWLINIFFINQVENYDENIDYDLTDECYKHYRIDHNQEEKTCKYSYRYSFNTCTLESNQEGVSNYIIKENEITIKINNLTGYSTGINYTRVIINIMKYKYPGMVAFKPLKRPSDYEFEMVASKTGSIIFDKLRVGKLNEEMHFYNNNRHEVKYIGIDRYGLVTNLFDNLYSVDIINYALTKGWHVENHVDGFVMAWKKLSNMTVVIAERERREKYTIHEEYKTYFEVTNFVSYEDMYPTFNFFTNKSYYVKQIKSGCDSKERRDFSHSVRWYKNNEKKIIDVMKILVNNPKKLYVVDSINAGNCKFGTMEFINKFSLLRFTEKIEKRYTEEYTEELGRIACISYHVLSKIPELIKMMNEYDFKKLLR